MPRTLDEAWAEAKAILPGPDAGLMELIKHHLTCAELFEDAAKTDPDHSDQALAWARIERREAETAQANLVDLVGTYLR